jgi:hypothetical protein
VHLAGGTEEDHRVQVTDLLLVDVENEHDDDKSQDTQQGSEQHHD